MFSASTQNQAAERSSTGRGFGAPSSSGPSSFGMNGAVDSRVLKKKKRHENSSSGVDTKKKSTAVNNSLQSGGNGEFKKRLAKGAKRQANGSSDDPPKRSRQHQRGRSNSKMQDATYRPTSSSSSSSSSSSNEFISRGELKDLSTSSSDYTKSIYNQLRKDGIKPPSWPADPGNPKHKATLVRFKEQYKAYRERARSSLIKAGLIDNPDDRKRLEDAIDFKGVCEDMCPDYEKIVRMTEFDVTSAEKDTDTGWPVLSRMVKKLARSAAGQEAPLPMDVRSIAALRKTLDYLFGELLLSDMHLKKHHGFLWDRTRAIRRDFAFFSSMTPEELVDQVYCLENITRFHVISLHLLSQGGNTPEDYSEHQEVEQLGNSLMSLKYAYDDCRREGIMCPNEAEFRAYELLVRANQPNILETAQREWDPHFWLQSDQVRTAVSLVEALHGTDDFHGPLTKGPSMAAEGAHRAYFRILESPKVSYTMACFAEVHFGQLRRSILQSLRRAYTRPRDPPKDITAETLNDHLSFDMVDEAIDFVQKHGLQFEPDQSDPFSKRHQILVLDNSPLSQSKVRHTFSRRFVESKRGAHAVSELMRRTVLPTDSKDDGLFIPQANRLDSSLDQRRSSSVVSDPKQGGSEFPNVSFADSLTRNGTNGPIFKVPASPKINPFLSTTSLQLSGSSKSSKPTTIQTAASSGAAPSASASSSSSSSSSPFISNPFSTQTHNQASKTPSYNPFTSTLQTGTRAENGLSSSTITPAFNPFSRQLSTAQNSVQNTKPNSNEIAEAPIIKNPFADIVGSTSSSPQNPPNKNASAAPQASAVPVSQQPNPFASAFPPPKPTTTGSSHSSPSTTAAFSGNLAPVASSVLGFNSQARQEARTPGSFPSSGLMLNGRVLKGPAATTSANPPSFLVPPASGSKPIYAADSQSPSIQVTPPTLIPPPFVSEPGSIDGAFKPPNVSGIENATVSQQSPTSQPARSLTTSAFNPLLPAELRQQSVQLLPLSPTTATAAPVTPVTPAQPSISKEKFFEDFAQWFVQGDRGLLAEFEMFAIEQLVGQVYKEYRREEKQRRRQESREKAMALALDFRRQTLSVKYFTLWRDMARQRALSRRCRSGRDDIKAFYASQRAAEKKATEQKQAASEAKKRTTVRRTDELADIIAKRRRSLREAEEAFLATGVLSGLTDERATAAQIVRGNDSLLHNRPRPKPGRSEENGLGRGWGPSPESARSVAVADTARSRVTKTSQFRRSLPPLPTRESFGSSQSPPVEKSGRVKRVNPISERWRLKAMGFVTLPNGSLGPEVLAESMRRSGSWSRTEALAPRLRRVSDASSMYGANINSDSPEPMAPPPPPLPSSSQLTSGSRRQGKLSSTAVSPSKRKRPAAEQEEEEEEGEGEEGSGKGFVDGVRAPSAVGAGAKRRHGESDTDRLIRELREMREEMEAGTAWYKEQNEVMQAQIGSRSGSRSGRSGRSGSPW